MKTTIASLLFALLLSGGTALAQTVTIDFDKTAVFGDIDSYSWVSTPDTSLERKSPLMHQRVVKAVENHLVRSGVREVDSNPDVLVTYHASSREKLRVHTSNYNYGYPNSWHRWDYGASYHHDTTVTTYTEGTLIIDIWDPATKSLIWRGTATAAVPRNPDKGGKIIDRAVDKMGRKWQKMKSKGKVRLAR